MRTYTVDFIEATNALSGKVTHEEIAEELGVSLGAVRQARIDPSSPHYRKPPPGWQEAIARLAERRGGELARLAKDLRRGGDG